MRKLSVRAKITLACVITTVASMAALTGANLWSARNTAESTALRSVDALSESYANSLGAWAAAKTDVVRSMAPLVEQADPLAGLVQAKQAGGYDTTYIGWADKRHVFSSPQNLPPDWDPTSRPWYQQAAAAGKPVLTAPYVDAGTKRLVVTFAAPVTDGGSVKAVTSGDIFIDGVVATVDGIKPSEHSFAYLVTSDGAIIAHPDAALTLKPATDAAPGVDAQAIAALRDAHGARGATIAGRDYWLTARSVPNTNWTLVIAQSRADAMAGVASAARTAVLLSLLLAAAAGVAIAVLTNALLRRLVLLKAALTDIASGEGDLTRRLATDGHDELAEVAQSFNLFVGKIAATLRSIRHTTDSVNNAATEIATGNQDLSSRTEQTASNLQQTASSMEQLTGAVQQTAHSARTANQLASGAAGAAQHGGDVVAKVVATMGEINDASKRIADIIGVIDGIAFQTNILALNAAVEAARAGEQGRGFAVVAGEVRTLAQRSAEAAKQIKSLIQASVERAEGGALLVQDAGQAMNEIVGSVRRVSDIIGEITAAAAEQSDGIAQVGQAVTHLDQMTQQNAALVEESAAAAESLRGQAHTLAEAIGAFKL